MVHRSTYPYDKFKTEKLPFLAKLPGFYILHS